jgi:hypothetical protein
MMRVYYCSTVALACSLVMFPALSTSAQTKAAKTKTNKVITLSGCVVRGETTPGQYTLEDKTAGGLYRLTGTDVRDYLGRRVQIVGGVPSKRLTIVGGLTPNPNVAAQAGAMDPVRAAMAAAGGAAGPGSVDLPEFRVKSVRPVSGGCPD